MKKSSQTEKQTEHKDRHSSKIHVVNTTDVVAFFILNDFTFSKSSAVYSSTDLWVLGTSKGAGFWTGGSGLLSVPQEKQHHIYKHN